MGIIDRIVLNLETNDVFQVVIKRGYLDTRKKIAPIIMFDHVTENRVILHEQVSNMDVILDFEEMHFIPYNFETEGKESKQKISAHYLYWYPPYDGLGTIALTPFSVKLIKIT